jgi:hypothetical protein
MQVNSEAALLCAHFRLLFEESSESEFGLLTVVPNFVLGFLALTLVKRHINNTDNQPEQQPKGRNSPATGAERILQFGSRVLLVYSRKSRQSCCARKRRTCGESIF